MESSDPLAGSHDEAELRTRMLRALGVKADELPFVMAIERGEIEGDLIPDHPMTDEEKQRIGLVGSVVDGGHL